MGLFSENAPTANFSKLGDEISGVIVDIYQHHRTQYGTGIPMYWVANKPTAGVKTDSTGKACDPVMDVVIVLDTDTPNEFGDTQRRLFIKGKQMMNGVKAARRASGAKDVEKGGRLSCKWSSGTGGQGGTPKVYEFTYKAPVAQTAFAETQSEEAPF